MDEGSIIKRGRKSILKYLIQLYKLTDRKYCYNPDLLAEPGRLAELEHGHVVVEPVGFEVRMSTVGKKYIRILPRAQVPIHNVKGLTKSYKLCS